MMELIHTNHNDPRFLELIDKLDSELDEQYGITQTFYNNYNGLQDILTVIIVCNGETSIACGCFKEYDQETGIKQPEAIRLYEKNGYTRIANYGPYINRPNSVCMKKIL